MSVKKFFSGAAMVLIGDLGNLGSAAGAQIDASHIIDKATAESILGEPVKPATPRNVEGNDGYYSKCNYYTAKPGKILIIRIYQAASGVDPQVALEMVAESTGAMTTISGLGERARMSSGTESGLPSHVVMLYVIKGNALITVGLAGLDDDTLAGQKAKSAAQKILADL
ncbi:MAG TPA: hypothetical protein DCO65_00130 [Spartobacteria bacterium]|jgi:hypothetical protein|nr:hypothetical protein [Spartobacteria bacterium]